MAVLGIKGLPRKLLAALRAASLAKNFPLRPLTPSLHGHARRSSRWRGAPPPALDGRMPKEQVMGWLAGYHNTLGERHYHGETWTEAHALIVDELDQRVMGLQSSEDYNRDELQDLIDAVRYFDALEPGEEAAADASGLTFALLPQTADDLALLPRRSESRSSDDPGPAPPPTAAERERWEQARREKLGQLHEQLSSGVATSSPANSGKPGFRWPSGLPGIHFGTRWRSSCSSPKRPR